ncbi:MAG: glycosyltransferase [Deltaproteobacteria bacterium]|nr:glycosyltransferase [Deltaproteobacteria bacterium]
MSNLSISIFVPAHNEEGNIERVVRNALTFLDAHADASRSEVIVVDDGSCDRTAEICTKLATTDPRVRLVSHPKNRGYGGAIKTGLSSARYDYVFFTDSDGQFDVNDLEAFLPHIDEKTIVVGRRVQRQDSFHRKLNAFCWGTLVRTLFGLTVKDIDCAFKIFPRQPLCDLVYHSEGALISTELLVRAKQRGYRIVQLPVRHLPRHVGTSTGANPKVILRAFAELFRLYARIRKPLLLFVLVAVLFGSTAAKAREIKMIFWYPGEAGSTAEAQPVLDLFFEALNQDLKPDQMSGKYFNTVAGGKNYIAKEKPALGIVSFPAWVQYRKTFPAASSEWLATLPLPDGKSTHLYRLVGPSKELHENSILISSEPLSVEFLRTSLFANLPQRITVRESPQLLSQLRTIADGQDKAYAILTPMEATTLDQLSSPWAKKLITVETSKPIPSASVILVDPSLPQAERLQNLFLTFSLKDSNKEILNELRLVGFETLK